MARHNDIAETLRAEIEAGKYAPQKPFPSVAQIVRRFGVAHLTAVKILDGLKKSGLVFSRQGSGTFVRKRPFMRIGIIVPAPSDGEFYPYICTVTSHVCSADGHRVLFSDIPALPAAEIGDRLRRQAESFVAERVNGVLFHPVDISDSAERINNAVLETFRFANVPVVLLDCGAGYDSFDRVGVDNVHIGWRLAEHLVSRGAKRILFTYRELKSGRLSPNAHLRLIGVRNYVMEHLEAVFLGECGIRDKGRSSLMSSVKRLKPDAVVCTSDYSAALAVKEIAASGRRVPEDVMVTGVNDIGVAKLVNPTLTTIRQPCEEIAKAAVETLKWRIENPSAAVRRIFLDAPLVARESTAAKPKTRSNGFMKRGLLLSVLLLGNAVASAATQSALWWAFHDPSVRMPIERQGADAVVTIPGIAAWNCGWLGI